MRSPALGLTQRQLVDRDEIALLAVAGDLNADLGDAPVEALRGEVEKTGNATLVTWVLVPCELTISDSARYLLPHQGRGRVLDHLLVSRSLLAFYRGAEVHNELLHDDPQGSDEEAPESDYEPVGAEFEVPDS